MKRLVELFDISLRVVFYKEGGRWIAHCLQFDLLGDGRTKEKALESLTASITCNSMRVSSMAIQATFSLPASEAWEMFALGKDTAVGNLSVCIERLAANRPKPYSLGDIRLRAYEGAKRRNEQPVNWCETLKMRSSTVDG